MCRLYGIAATHPTRIRCELVHAQNSLIRQSERDGRGLSNPHGWGIGYHTDDGPKREREVGPASVDEEYRLHAADAESTAALAHVRRATVGEPAEANTHPFVHGRDILAHNGHIPAFEVVGQKMREAMVDAHREAISGSTDSECFFHLLLSNRQARPDQPMHALLKGTALQVLDWCRQVDTEETPMLNFLWISGERLAGMRLGRTLWWVETPELFDCAACGERHASPTDRADYHSVEFASERITDEAWKAMPPASVFEVTEEMEVVFEALI